MFNHWAPFHCQKAIFLCIAVLLSPTLHADQKPYAPETIQDVTIVSAEETIDLILENPDLIVIDGGKGQLNAALKSLQSLGLKTSCVSLAKEHEEIFIPNHKSPVLIPKNKASLKILQHARDETHRFGVAYNRTIRKNQIK